MRFTTQVDRLGAVEPRRPSVAYLRPWKTGRTRPKRARAKEARQRAEQASTDVIRRTLLDDAEMFERMARAEEERNKQYKGPGA